METQFDFTEIVRNFCFKGDFKKAIPHGCGHINDTFIVVFDRHNGKNQKYILQRINHHVFTRPEKLMDNINGLTHFLREKIILYGGNPERETLNLIPAKNGKFYYKSSAGDYWRSYAYIEGARTYQTVLKPEHFYCAGKAFGKFQSLLSDYPAEELYEVIPDFHNTKKRFGAFLEAVDKDVVNRAVLAKEEIAFVEERAADASVLVDLLEKGDLPIRVTHNDTKFNNVLIDDITGQGICILDLDTAMPGLSLYDFGDSIRSGANPADEDEQDLKKVCIDLSLFEEFTKGFLEAANAFLIPTEVDYLSWAAKIITFECGMRFLTDYLNGDTYFKIHREGHNLDRARTQLKMVKDMEMKMDKMNAVVDKYR